MCFGSVKITNDRMKRLSGPITLSFPKLYKLNKRSRYSPMDETYQDIAIYEPVYDMTLDGLQDLIDKTLIDVRYDIMVSDDFGTYGWPDKGQTFLGLKLALKDNNVSNGRADYVILFWGKIDAPLQNNMYATQVDPEFNDMMRNKSK